MRASLKHWRYKWTALLACAAVLFSFGAANADTISRKGFFNGKTAACNFVESSGNWHVVSTTYSAKVAGKPAFGILAPATFFLIYDPSTAPGFKLGDVLGYEKRWGPYRGKIPKEPPLFNYTGAWPIGGYQPIGKAYQIGRPPMIVITMDALRTSFKLSLPPGYRQTPTPVPELLNTYRATWGKEPLGDKPTFLTINAGDGRNILLEATLGAFKQRKFEKLHGKMRHVGDEQLTDQYFYADFQTYKDGVFKMKQDMVKEKKMPNMAYTQAADAMLGYFINAAKGSNDMLTITAAEKGQFVYKISVGGFRKAAELLAKGLVHHRQNVLNPDCW